MIRALTRSASAALTMGSGFIERATLRGATRKLTRVGASTVFHGAPFVSNEGRIEVGDHCSISSTPVKTHLVAERGGTISIADHVVLGHGCGLACRSRITIGQHTHLGPFSMFIDTDYHVVGDAEAEAPTGPINIGEHVRIGSHVTILRDTTIGAGATVLDGAVVSGVVPAGATVAGVPARVMASARLAESGQSERTVEERIPEVAQRAFRLIRPPSLTDGRYQIPGWDSLGSLSLLITLEEEFALPLNESHLVGVKNLLDLARVVESEIARQHG